MAVPENHSIKQTNQLLSSLLTEIPLIQTFRGKWSIIRTKLTSLQTQLQDFDSFPSSSSNPLSLDLLQSISQTLNDAFSLSQKCKNPGLLSEGKLKTQSDIDLVMAKLDKNVKDCEILIGSGVLEDGVCSGWGSKKEVIRAESRNLMTRLQIGNAESRNSAMDSLLRLIHEEDDNNMIAVAQGVVPVLVRLFDSSSMEMKEKIVVAIARISIVDSSKHVLAAEGLLLLTNLIRVLEWGSGFAKEKVCAVLYSLSVMKENARVIGSRGGISLLLEICNAGTPGSQALALGVLRNLAQFSYIKENLIEENVIVTLLRLSASGTKLAQENAIGCLSNLVCDDDKLKLFVVKEGGLECLKNFWDSASTVVSVEVAIEFMRQLGSCRSIPKVLIADGFVTRIIVVYNCGVLSLRIAAALAVFEMGYSTRMMKEMGECGCIGPLIKMLDGKAAQEKEAAAKALSALMIYEGNQKVFRRNDRGIVCVVQLLDPSVLNLDKKYLVSILGSLVHSKNCRKQMIASGACIYLQKLVEMDVGGAKKVLESLARVKFWGVFARP